MKYRPLALLAFVLGAGCSGAPKPPPPSVVPPPVMPVSVGPESWRAQKPAPGPRVDVTYPKPEVVRLENGMSVYAVPRPGGIALFSIVSRHGASSLPSGKSGVAALTARMLTEGTRTKSSLALAEAAEALGATLDADAGRDYTSVSMPVLREDAVRGLELLAEVVKTPAFDPKEFERVRAEWLDGLLAERQQPTRAASLVALRALLGAQQGAPVGGSIPDVKALKVTDLAAFHRSAFVPANVALVIAGDVKLAELRNDVERLFGNWRATAPPEPATREAPKLESTRILLVDRPDAVQTALFVAQPFPKRSAPGYEIREVLNQVLGGLFTSRINRNLREQHAYTYGARSQAIAARHFGVFVVATSVETRVTAEALTELSNELRAARDPALGRPFQNDELGRARADLTNSLGAHLEHVSRMSDDLQTLFIHELPPRYFSQYSRLIDGITREQVAEQAAALLTPDRLVIVAVGDKGAIQPALEKRGFKVEVADPKLLE